MAILFLEPLSIAKLATGFQMLIFVGVSSSLILMRESQIEAYDPGFKVPFYPWTPITGILLGFLVLANLGWQVMLFTAALVLFGSAWYRIFTRKNVVRLGAVYHVFQRLGEKRFAGLDVEMRALLKEKEPKNENLFEALIDGARFVEEETDSFGRMTNRVDEMIEKPADYPAGKFAEEIMEGSRIGSTPVSDGVALPHVRIEGLEGPRLVFARSRRGIDVRDVSPLFTPKHRTTRIHAFFFLASPQSQVNEHLRLLASLARIADQTDFIRTLEPSRKPSRIEGTLQKPDGRSPFSRRGAPFGEKWREPGFPWVWTVLLFMHQGSRL